MFFFVSQVDADDDSLDIAVIAVDTMRISHPEVAQAALIDTELACGEWEGYAEEAQFFILGYPDERATIDPDTLEFRADRVTLFGGYDGPSFLPLLHLFRVSDSLGFTTFSGFSGGPVFAWIERPGQRPVTVLCGMVLRRTPKSGQIHFLDRDMLLDALAAKRRLELGQRVSQE